MTCPKSSPDDDDDDEITDYLVYVCEFNALVHNTPFHSIIFNFSVFNCKMNYNLKLRVMFLKAAKSGFYKEKSSESHLEAHLFQNFKV